MPTAVEFKIPERQSINGCEFPLGLLRDNDSVTLAETFAWLRESKQHLLDQLQAHGAILFRGFPVESAEDFDAFVESFDLPGFPYEDSLSNAVRINYTPRVFSANEAPPDVSIYLHHEMAQTPIYPSKLFFFCEHPATEGGATPLCRSDLLWTRIQSESPQFAADCESKGLRYTNVMPSDNDPESGMGRSWRSTFSVQTKEQAQLRMADLGYSWEWRTDESLKATSPVLPAVRALPDGRKTFFNQLIAAFRGWKDTRNDPSKAIVFGDGTPLDPSIMLHVVDIAESLCFDVEWQQGDVALVDNFTTMHARRTFSGTRKVLAAFVA